MEEKYLLSVFCDSLFVKGCKNVQLRIVTIFVFCDCIAFPQRPLGSFMALLFLSMGFVRSSSSFIMLLEG